MQYHCGYYMMGVPLRVLCGYSAATAYIVAPVIVTTEYPQRYTSLQIATAVLHYMRSTYAAINGYLELTLLKGRQGFDAISMSNLEVYKFWDW